jgi:hypothetical protein
MKFSLGTVCVHPGTPQRDTQLFPMQPVVPYATTLPNLQPDIETSILLCGDFKVDVNQIKALLEIMKEIFDIGYVTESSTTLGNTLPYLAFAEIRALHFSVLLPSPSVKQIVY